MSGAIGDGIVKSTPLPLTPEKKIPQTSYLFFSSLGRPGPSAPSARADKYA